MAEDQNKDKKEEQDLNDKTQIFFRCQIHNISYPQGSICPECERNQKDQ